MDNESSTSKIKRRAERALARRATDLDRVEYLALVLNAFAQPVPDYEPHFAERIGELLRRKDDYSSPSSSRR
jgi:hypothetical protein